MNIIKRELKSNHIALIAWSIGLSLLIILSFAKIDTNNPQSIALVNSMLKDMPASLQYLVGFNPNLNLAVFSDYYMMIYQYTVLIVSIYAVIIGCDIVAKEENDRTVDFLYTKPYKRTRILKDKLIAGFILNLILALVCSITLIVTYYVVSKQHMESTMVVTLIKLMTFQFLTQLIFYFIGFGINSLTTAKKTQTLAFVIIGITYMVSKLVDMFNLTLLSYLTPFQYFDPYRLIHLQQNNLIYPILMVGIIIVTVLMTLKNYQNKDLL